MEISTILLVFSFAAGVVAAWEKLTNPDNKKRTVGWITVLLLLSMLSFQWYRDYRIRSDKESNSFFVENEEVEIDEASGGAMWEGKICIVDDEERYIYKYKYAEKSGKAKLEEKYRITDNRSEQGMISKKVVNKVDDLEGVASYNKELYLVTSHSLNKKEESKDARELLLRITALFNKEKEESQALVGNAASLTNAIQNAFKKKVFLDAKLEYTDDRVNIEGFAIDKKGIAYFGLRNPLVKKGGQKYAIILKGNIKDMFSSAQELEPILLRMDAEGKSYGITSLDFYDETLFILANSSEKRFCLPPKIWKLFPCDTDSYIKYPILVDDWSLNVPGDFRRAKPEVVILPPDSQQVFVFLDALGHGGQRVYAKRTLVAGQ